jgi:hypothetical protein
MHHITDVIKRRTSLRHDAQTKLKLNFQSGPLRLQRVCLFFINT